VKSWSRASASYEVFDERIEVFGVVGARREVFPE
jgi:hypothetical protein